jgi:hypothetical protein
MAKVKRMADGGISSLGQMMPKSSVGGGDTATSGLDQISQGKQTLDSAISTAQNALGGGSSSGGSVMDNSNSSSPVDSNGNQTTQYKMGGSVKKSSLNKVRTASKNVKNPNW